jgi:hypothetical protein
MHITLKRVYEKKVFNRDAIRHPNRLNARKPEFSRLEATLGPHGVNDSLQRSILSEAKHTHSLNTSSGAIWRSVQSWNR